ncbi:hypothetical protein BD410DRAFT_785114 [Rickenella mellea]|uniref:Uncharacterized protein n=1 Tax=Rickenella mellea TaxID=50990 RepID=A0A4Y7QC22_9AGAM|nr:hypothetical protein BD410DRAFT_785114 [Rickenella mellea]
MSPTLSPAQFISHAFEQPGTSQVHPQLSPSPKMTASSKISKGLASRTQPDVTGPSSQTTTMENSKPPRRHSKHKSGKQPKSSRIPDPPPRGTFSSFSYRAPLSSQSNSNDSSSDSRPTTPVLSITEIELLRQISLPAPHRMSSSRGQQPPEPPMSSEEWRKTTEWRRAHKFERALRTRDRIGEKENGGVPQLPLDVACEMVSAEDNMKGEAKRQALARILEPPLARAARIRTMSWVDSPPPSGLEMEMDVEVGDNPNSSPEELSVDEDAGTASEVAGKCESLKLSSLES